MALTKVLASYNRLAHFWTMPHISFSDAVKTTTGVWIFFGGYNARPSNQISSGYSNPR
jgi:hypothetical protein